MDQVIVFILSSTKVLPFFLFHLPNVGLVVRTCVAMEIYKYISTTNTEKGRGTGLAVCDKRRLQTCRPQTCRLADLQTCRLADLQTCGLAETFGTHGEGGGG